MKIKSGVFLIIVLCLLAFLIFVEKKMFFDQPLYIAVVVPNNANGEAMKQGVQLYLDKINHEGGILGRKVLLKSFNEPNNQENNQLKKVANDVIESDALTVIGHYSSDSSLVAAPIYKEKIPAITGTATADKITEENDWYFRVIFNNSSQGAVVANYVRKALDYENAYIFYEEDSYGQTLKEAFVETAKNIQLGIEGQWGFKMNNNEDFRNKLNEMVNTLIDKDECVLFLATHSEEAKKIIPRLHLLKCQIIGADALASSLFREAFKKAGIRYYTDGIYTVSPFILNLAGKPAQDFKRDFLKTFPKLKTKLKTKLTTAAMYYDATMVAVDAIKKTLVQEQTFDTKSAVNDKVQAILEHKDFSGKEKRRRLVQYNLRYLSKLENALEGVTGALYFDKNGDAIKPVLIGLYEKGNLLATFEQYQPITNLQSIDNLLQKILDNEIIQVNDKFMRHAHVVYVGMDFNDIQELDVKKSIYTADFYLWFRSKLDEHENEHKHHQFYCIKFVNIFDPKDNNLGRSLSGQEQRCEEEKSSETETSGEITTTYHLKRKFKVDFDFKDYPLDKQTLFIRFRHNNLTTNELIYVVDTRGMGLDKLGDQSVADKIQAEKRFSLSSWKMNEVSFFQNSQKKDSTLGEPTLFDSLQRLEYSQFNVEIKIDRHVWSFILKNLLPVLFVVGLGYAVYFTNVFATKMMLSVNVILATSLFHLKLASSALAAVEYNTLLEYFFYLVYTMGIFGVITSLIFHVKNEAVNETKDTLKKLKEAEEPDERELEEVEERIAKDKRIITRIDWMGRIGYPLALFIFMMVMFYMYHA